MIQKKRNIRKIIKLEKIGRGMSRNPNPKLSRPAKRRRKGLDPATRPYICIAPTMSAWLGDCFAWARVPWVATFSETNATRSRTEVCKDPRSRGQLSAPGTGPCTALVRSSRQRDPRLCKSSSPRLVAPVRSAIFPQML